jgi:hypothetical protein
MDIKSIAPVITIIVAIMLFALSVFVQVTIKFATTKQEAVSTLKRFFGTLARALSIVSLFVSLFLQISSSEPLTSTTLLDP